MSEFLQHDVPDQLTGLGFVITAIILAMWGLALVGAAHRRSATRPWYDPRGWVRPTFEFWLGVFILADAGLWAFLAWATLSTPATGVPAWAAIYFGAAAITAVVAFAYWARERIR
jgi:hypothetical protein